MKHIRLSAEEIARARDLSHARQVAGLKAEIAGLTAQLIDAQSALIFARKGLDPAEIGDVVLAEGEDFGVVRDRNGQPFSVPDNEPPKDPPQ